MRALSFRIILVSIVLTWPCTVAAMEALLPFEDQTTHLWGYRTSGGAVMIEPRFLIAEQFSHHGMAAVVDESGWQYIDGQGSAVIRPFVFDNGPDPFHEGLARFKTGEHFGFFDERGRVIIAARFDFAAPFADGLAAFCQGCKARAEGEYHRYEGGVWGFIDKAGNVVITPKYAVAEAFAQGQARVMLDGRWVTINRNGDPIQ
jgi:hypothetical protein